MSAVKLPLAVRKSIRDEFDPYVPEFEKTMEEILGIKWTLEMPWTDCLTAVEDSTSSFKQIPGSSAANYFKEAAAQLKKITKDGKDDMVVEAINEAADKHIMTIIVDDKITSWSDCRIVDGKLCIVFKAKSSFGCGISESMENLVSIL